MRESVELWLSALRSGDYEQTKGKLRKDDTFCCLGVACDLAVKNGILSPEDAQMDTMGWWSYDGEPELLPRKVQDWLGLAEKTGGYNNFNCSLAADNDSGIPFTGIADIIESKPDGLFVTEEEK